MCVEIVDLPHHLSSLAVLPASLRWGVRRCYKVSMAVPIGATDLVLRAEPSLVRDVLPVFA